MENNEGMFGAQARRVTMPVCDRVSATEISNDYTLPDYQSEIRRVLYVGTSVLPPAKYVSTGGAEISCCGRRLQALEPVKAAPEQKLTVEAVEDEWFLTSSHPMTKEHHIAFVAFAAGERLQLIRQYPEWDLQVRLPARGRGMLLWYCTQHGLFAQFL